MPGDTVGFSFQADVTNTGSLLHSLTGRALKAMSDGGVDFYAVIAVITLGKGIVLRDSLGDTVRPHIISKGVFQSVLSKALSIGWGHKVLAIEMASTKAGTNALLLIGALAAGPNNFQAAQCLSELLSLRGCEPDRLPSVDVLKHMIGYCAPFVYDLGFAKVLENVTTTAIHRIKTKTQDHSDPYNYLTRCGDAVGVSGGINQLFLTSQKKESYYAITRIRGAWFATFAAHILGMAVELRLDDAVLWASAGNNGVAIFELGEHQINEMSIQAMSNGRIELVNDSDTRCDDEIEIDYLVGEIFESLAAQEPRISRTIWEGIGRGICQVAFTLLRKYMPRSQESFALHDAFRETLKAFRLDISSTDFVEPLAIYNSSRLCLDMLDKNTRKMLRTACGKHEEPHLLPLSGDCICLTYVENLMHNFAASIVCLTHCHFDWESLRISHRRFGENRRLRASAPNERRNIPFRDILTEIAILTSCVDNHDQLNRRVGNSNEPKGILGYSGGRHTVGFTCLLESDCYDNQGRFLSIWSGLASVENAIRPIIIEEAPLLRDPSRVSPSTLAPGSIIEPHYCPSALSIYTSVFLDEESIMVQFRVGSEKHLAIAVSFIMGAETLAKSRILRCQHNSKDRYKVEPNQNLVVSGLNIPRSLQWRKDDNVTTLFALHGNKMEQIFAAENAMSGGIILQLLACLQCCISASLSDNNPQGSCVVMGG